MARVETWEVGPTVVVDVLSDGSKAHNVILTVDGMKLTIACESRRGAEAVVKVLEANVAWYLIESQARAT